MPLRSLGNAPAAIRRRPMVMIAEPDWATARHLAEVLNAAGMMVLRPVHGAREAIDQATRAVPDLIVSEVKLDGGADGINAARTISRRHDVALLFVSGQCDESTLHRAAGTGAAGFLVKPFSDGQLLASVRLALFSRPPSDDENSETRHVRLSPREAEIAEALAEGSRVTRIAAALAVSPHTVRNHLRSIFRKLEINSQQELIDVWRRQRDSQN